MQKKQTTCKTDWTCKLNLTCNNCIKSHFVAAAAAAAAEHIRFLFCYFSTKTHALTLAVTEWEKKKTREGGKNLKMKKYIKNKSLSLDWQRETYNLIWLN
jgi:hypothetical protein